MTRTPTTSTPTTRTPTRRTAPVRASHVYEAALRSTDGGLWAVGGARGTTHRRRLPVELWRGGLAPGDRSLLARCDGPTLDVGCGPGRLVGALAARGVVALGVDVAPAAVALAQQAGVAAVCRDVFGPLPGAGRWHVALLADGNIGIGGSPRRLLARVRDLLAPGGCLLAELAEPGSPTAAYWARLATVDVVSAPFAWAEVSIDDAAPVAASAGLAVAETWQEADRHFARFVVPAASAKS